MSNSSIVSTARGESVSQPTFKRTLGVGAIVFMVIAAAAPLTVVAGTVPLVFSTSGSIAVPAFYLVAAVILVIFSLGFTAMSLHVQNAGAFYSYIQAGSGRVMGIGAATLALFSYTVLLIGVYAYCGSALGTVITRYTGLNIPWWAWTALELIIVAILGYRDISLSSKVLGVLLVAEGVVVILLDAGVIGHGGQSGLNLQPFSPTEFGVGKPGLGLMFAFFGFIGFEATAVFRDETKDPERVIPRATYIAVSLIGVFYAFSAWAIAMGAGTGNIVQASAKDPEGLVAAMAKHYVIPVLGDVVQVLLVTSLFACVLSFHNVVTRYLYSLGQKHVLSARLGEVHTRHNSPSQASLVATVVTAVAFIIVALCRLDPVTQIYAWLSGAATLGLMLLMALTSLSVVLYFTKHKYHRSLWRTVVSPLISLVALVIIIALVLANFPLLVGNTTAAIIMALVVFISFFVGVGMAIYIQRKHPTDWESLREKEISA